MSDDVQQLVLDAVELTGAPPPAMLDADAPVLAATRDVDAFYLIGLIGGKDVGKSSLVNALVGQQITQPSSFGEGTQRVVAYVHENVADELRAMLKGEIGEERFSIVPHRIDSLRRQVLLDLPDIDSHWTAHLQLTRRMLRHMLYPLWVQSVEKYADQQPQELLRQVASGNDPANFIFCLSKVDQVVAREKQAAIDELAKDYARRIASALKLPREPRVHLISAVEPDRFDLPSLRRALANEKSVADIERSTGLADARRRRSLLNWLEEQKLSERAQHAVRLAREAQELIAAEIAMPLLEDTLPAIVADPAHRLAMVEPAMAMRLSRWPIVNVVHTTLSPLMALVRKNLASAPTSRSGDDAALLAGGRTLPALIQSSFAKLRRSDPLVAQLYEHRQLWESMPADAAARDLANRIQQTILRQREQVVRVVASRGALEVITWPLRWILTLGAVLWFPIIQPILEQMVKGDFTPTVRAIAALIVPLLGASYLLHTAGFLLIYFAALWMLLRWDTHRRVNRLVARWSRAGAESELSLHGQVLRWIDDLLDPLRSHEQQVTELSRRIDTARHVTSP